MARQRLNVSFLLKFGCALLVAAGAAYGLWKFRKPHNPAPYITAGDDAMKRFDYNTAAQNYAIASELLPQQEDLYIKLGRCDIQLQHAGVDTYEQAVNAFTKAEELKPKDPDAWIGLLEINEFLVQSIEMHPKAPQAAQRLSQALSIMRDAADHLVALQPDNVLAQSAGPILTIRTWIAKLTLPDTAQDKLLPAEKRPTTEKRAEQAIADLTKLIPDHPENEKIPYWVARAKLFQAQEALRSAHPEHAGPLFAEASTQFDASIAARPEVVGLYLGKAEILTRLRDMDNSPANDYRKRLRSTLEIVQGLVDPVKAPDDYERAKMQWAENLRITDPTGAEDVYRKLIETFPDHLQLRIQLARLLETSGRQADALAVLDVIPTLQGPPVTDIRRRELWDLQVANSKVIRANIEVDQLATTPVGAARDALVKDITASIDAAQRRFAGTSQLLRVQGRFQMAMGQRRDAIDTLTAAAEKMYAEGGGIDYELLRLEAIAYRDGGQLSRAVELLEKAMIDPIVRNNNEIHLLLAQMNIQNQDYAKARQYVDWLAERLPDNPQVVLLEIQELGPQPDWSKVAPLWKNLPEEAPVDISLKAQLASALDNNDEAIRLWSKLNKDKPGDITVAIKLTSCDQQAGKIADAIAVIEECIKLNPDNPVLPPLLVQLKGTATPEQLTDLTIDAIKKIKSPYAQEIAFIKFYRIHEQPEQEIAHLVKALELQPDDKELLSALFFLYVNSQRFTEAQAMLQHMADDDVDSAHGLILRCKLALAMNDPTSAIVFGRQMTHDLPNFAASWEMYGEGLMASGQLDLAADQFQAALQLQYTNTEALSNLIKCEVAQGKNNAAKTNLETACRRFPTNTVFRNMRQRFEINYDNDPESILPELTQQILDHPDDVDGYLMIIDALQASVRVEAGKGNAVAANSFQQQARDHYVSALQKWPDDLRFARGLAMLYVVGKDLPNAEKVMQAIADRPRWKKYPKPLIILGQIYMAAGKLDLAEAALKSARDLQPDSVEAMLTLSECRMYENQPDMAIAGLMPGLGNLSVRAKYTELLLQMRRFPEAELEVDDAMKAQPNNYALTNLKLEVYYAEASQRIEGKRDLGIKLATDSINGEHANVYAYLWRAKLLMAGSNPDLETAGKDLTLFLTSVPTDAEGHLLKAQVIDGKNDRDGAINELQDAMKLAPQDRGIRLYLIKDYLTAVPSRTLDAEQLLTATLALPSFANDPDFEIRLALLQVQKGDNSDAVATAQKAMADAANKNVVMPDYFKVLLETKNYDLVLTESSKYFAKDADRPWYVCTDRGIARAGMGDSTGAESEFNAALDKAGVEPGSEAGLQVATSISTCGKPFNVDKALAMILPRAEGSPAWRLVAVQLYLMNNDQTGALKEVDLAMSSLDRLILVDQFRLEELASNIYLSAVPPMVDKALDANQKVLAMQPDNINALNDVACILVDMGTTPNPKEALKYSQHAYDLSVKNGSLEARVADTQGWVLIQNGKVEDGITILHKALDIMHQNFPEAHYHLAVGYMKINRVPSAREQLNQAKQLIDDSKSKGQPIDPAFANKVDAALSQVNGTVGVNTTGGPAPQAP